MTNIYTSAEQLIGNTPLLELTHIEKELGLKAKILVKLGVSESCRFSQGSCRKSNA